MHFFDIFPETIFLMANIFAGMGKGANSGKLTFRKICGGEGICVTEDAKGITFSAIGGGGGASFIDQKEIAFGTGTGITSSYFCVSEGKNITSGIFGFRVINQSPSSNVVGDTAYGSFIIGGATNTLNSYQKRSVILGSRDTNLSHCYSDNSIISSCNTNTSSRSGNSSIISNYRAIGRTSHGILISNCTVDTDQIKFHSSISSSYTTFCSVYTTGISSAMFSSISSRKASLSLNYGSSPNTGKFIHNSVISSDQSGFYSQIYSGYVSNATIISSAYSKIPSIKYAKKVGYTYHCSQYSSIISSNNSRNSSGYSTILNSKYACLVGADNSWKGATRTQINSIISSYSVKSRGFVSSSIISSGYSNFYHPYKSGYGTIISSNNGAIGSRSTVISANSPSLPQCDCLNTIIGGNSINIRYGSISMGGHNHYFANFDFGFDLQSFEPPDKSLFIAGRTIFGSFINIGGQSNYGYGFSIMVGGANNRSSCSQNSRFNAYTESRQGRANGTVVGSLAGITTASQNSILIGGSLNKDYNTINSSIIGGISNHIKAMGCYAHYNYINNPLPNTVVNTFIIGGSLNCVVGPGLYDATYMPNWAKSPYQVKFSGIIGGCNNRIVGLSNPQTFNNPSYPSAVGLTSSVIIGGSNVCSCFSYSMSADHLNVRGTIKTRTSGGTICTGFTGNVVNPTSMTVVNGLVTNLS